MHRDICATNREAIVRWLDSAVDELQHMRSLVAAGSTEADETLLARFQEAREARADWSTAERQGHLIQDTEGELSRTSVSEQMSHMLVGNMFRRRPRLDSGNSRGRKKAIRPDRE